jgi:hypothetical protein
MGNRNLLETALFVALTIDLPLCAGISGSYDRRRKKESLHIALDLESLLNHPVVSPPTRSTR